METAIDQVKWLIRVKAAGGLLDVFIGPFSDAITAERYFKELYGIDVHHDDLVLLVPPDMEFNFDKAITTF